MKYFFVEGSNMLENREKKDVLQNYEAPTLEVSFWTNDILAAVLSRDAEGEFDTSLWG